MKQSPRKIRFTKTLATSRQTFRRGHEYDVTDSQATEYVAKGIATDVKAPVTPHADPKPKATGKSKHA